MDDLDRIASATVIRPGDKLVLQVPVGTTMEFAQAIQSRCVERLPGVEVVIVAADGMALYRSEPQE